MVSKDATALNPGKFATAVDKKIFSNNGYFTFSYYKKS